MTSDHVEKLLDAQRICDGARPVFLTGNGGREPIQFYALAALHGLGAPMSFDLLKLLSGAEGVLGIAAVFFLAWELAGAAGPVAAAAAPLAAGLTAVSFWHVLLSRLGLRIALAPLFVSLVALFTIRALRRGARADFLRAGLALGAGLYAYQNVRIVPLLVAAGAACAFALGRRREDRVRLASSFGALVLVSAAVFVPLGRFMVDDPASFWSRSAGRLFGAPTITATDPATGAVVSRATTPAERRAALAGNLRRLGSNLARSLRMFLLAGDASWITGTPSGRPELDPAAGALLLVGFGAFAARAVRDRDAAAGFVLLAIPVLVLPTALAIAMPQEVPSATRASGAIPFAFALAGYGGAACLELLRRAARVRRSLLIALACAGVPASAAWDVRAYFGEAIPFYRLSAKPHAQLGALVAAFSRSSGAPGNAFMVGYPNSWDHRAIAIEAGELRWDNGLVPPVLARLDERVRRNAGGRYALDPRRPLLFLLDGRDDASLTSLTTRFPSARVRRVRSFRPAADFLVVVVPAGPRPPG